MAKEIEQNVVGVRPTTIALVEATFAAALGFGIAVLHGLSATFQLTDATNSVLLGLSLGIGTGLVLVIVLPLVYFALGWLLGYIHGWILNAVIRAAGGVTVFVEK